MPRLIRACFALFLAAAALSCTGTRPCKSIQSSMRGSMEPELALRMAATKSWATPPSRAQMRRHLEELNDGVYDRCVSLPADDAACVASLESVLADYVAQYEACAGSKACQMEAGERSYDRAEPCRDVLNQIIGERDPAARER